jgi:hypothetical protein
MSLRRLSQLPVLGLFVIGGAAGCSASGDDGGIPRNPLPPENGDCSGTLTTFPGDCRRPAPVDPSEGAVAHYGPLDYDDPDQIAEFVILPGKEFVDCTYSQLSNDAPLNYNRYSVYSRPSMHHIILYAQESAVADGIHDDCTAKRHGSTLLAVLQGGIEGSRFDYPPSGQIAPENSGLATKLAPHQMIAYEMHAVNATDQPLLRENWTVFYAMPESEVKGTVGQLAFNGGLAMHIEPHSRATITNSCVVSASTGPVRVLDFFGHMHAHGERFSAWVSRPGADGTAARSLVYESYDWSILDLIEFNSVKQNTPVRYGSGTPGGYSGGLELNIGDRLEYECAMNNTSEQVLSFSAEAFAGEMCNLFGSFTPGTYWSCVGE